MLGEPDPRKSANWPRNFGRSGACGLEAEVLLSKATVEGPQVAVTREERLFNKNAGDRESERICTVSEACPVRVCESPFQGEEAPANGGGNSDRRKVA